MVKKNFFIKSKIRIIGNSAGVIIPLDFLKFMNLEINTEINIGVGKSKRKNFIYVEKKEE